MEKLSIIGGDNRQKACCVNYGRNPVLKIQTYGLKISTHHENIIHLFNSVRRNCLIQK
jgi:hypothetical protein